VSFSNDLQNFNKKTLEVYSKVKRGSSLDLFSAIVLETPVDKGTLRGNWFADIGSPNTEISDAVDESGQITISTIKAVLQQGDMADDVFLTNNLPYATVIEFDGHSAKAPAGMVRVNTVRWKSIVDTNIRKFANAF